MSPRETVPALGTRGGPASYRRGSEGASVALHVRRFADAAWSFLYARGTRYAREWNGAGAEEAAGGRAGMEPLAGQSVHVDAQVAQAARRARLDGSTGIVQGPVMKPAVWTWEVPVYFWFGGIAAGASFVALACDLAGDRRSAATARKLALAGVAPCPPLLISDLGRPARFLNMLRIFKPRSPMSMGAWCMSAFASLAVASVASDLAGRSRVGRAIGAVNAVIGGYLGSYTGVLLASTAVPLWARSRLFLGPIFVATAAATGAAATRLVLVAGGLPEGHPTRRALGRIETASMASELVLSGVNERRLGPLARPLSEGQPGRLFKLGKGAVASGHALRLARRRLGRPAHDLASVLYLVGGLAFRQAWVAAGHVSADDDRVVAETARAHDDAG